MSNRPTVYHLASNTQTGYFWNGTNFSARSREDAKLIVHTAGDAVLAVMRHTWVNVFFEEISGYYLETRGLVPRGTADLIPGRAASRIVEEATQLLAALALEAKHAGHVATAADLNKLSSHASCACTGSGMGASPKMLEWVPALFEQKK